MDPARLKKIIFGLENLESKNVIKPEEQEEGWALTIAMCTAGLVALTGLYGVLGAIP